MFFFQVNSVLCHVGDLLGFTDDEELHMLYEQTAWMFDEKYGRPGAAYEAFRQCAKLAVLNITRQTYEYMSRVMRKPTFCICENKDADQLRGNREADQRLCFRYIVQFLFILNPKFLAIFCVASDLVENQNVGFPTKRLIYLIVHGNITITRPHNILPFFTAVKMEIFR